MCRRTAVVRVYDGGKSGSSSYTDNLYWWSYDGKAPLNPPFEPSSGGGDKGGRPSWGSVGYRSLSLYYSFYTPRVHTGAYSLLQSLSNDSGTLTSSALKPFLRKNGTKANILGFENIISSAWISNRQQQVRYSLRLDADLGTTFNAKISGKTVTFTKVTPTYFNLGGYYYASTLHALWQGAPYGTSLTIDL